jgi:hypothetical protein
MTVFKKTFEICQLSAPVDAASRAHHPGVFTVSQGKHITGNVVAFTLGPTRVVNQNGLSGGAARWDCFVPKNLGLIL